MLRERQGQANEVAMRYELYFVTWEKMFINSTQLSMSRYVEQTSFKTYRTLVKFIKKIGIKAVIAVHKLDGDNVINGRLSKSGKLVTF